MANLNAWNLFKYGVLIGGILCLLYAYFIEPYRLEVNTVDIFTDKLHGNRLTIVQIADLHCDLKARNEDKLAEIINPLKPDIIVFTGDAINSLEGLPVFKLALRRLDAGIGKYGVTGNIDEWFWPGVDLFEGTGFRRLNRESIQLSKDGETFFISGLNYGEAERAGEALRAVPPDAFNILLYHSPDLIEDLKGMDVDLYLAGHTHGGQVALPFYGAIIALSKYGKKYEAGKYVVAGTTLYVNRGVGMEGGIVPRIRFFARPEIAVFNIRPAVMRE